MRGRSVLTVLAVAMVAVCFLPPSEGDSGSFGLYEVYPYGDGIVLGPFKGSQDLCGYSLTDGEGTVTFSESYIPSEGYLLIAPKADSRLPSGHSTVYFGEDGLTKKGSLILKDSGDEVILRDPSGNLVESLCYGNSSGAEGWDGDPVGIGSGKHLVRIGDAGSAAGWTVTKNGWTNFPVGSGSFTATVVPFTFPESSGIPVLEALESADTSICISMYLLTSRNAAALLESKAASGVDVRILLEGNPLGVSAVSGELPLMKAIADAGADIRLINDSGSTRYTYLHNKYAVIDGETVVITSENWTSGNIGSGGNRGWGAVVESSGYASYMETVFENDFSKDFGDVVSLSDAYPNLVADQAYYESPGTFAGTAYAATVSPVLSPDNSMESLKGFIGSATTRVYSQQLDLGSNLCTAYGDTPIAWMAEAASDGLDVRFMLDASNDESHYESVATINATTTVKALAVDGREGFDTIHNKGVICDDSVWVGSVNWTSNSFSNNREAALIIDSAGVADYFAGYFTADWGITLDSVRDGGMGFRALYDPSEGIVELIAIIPDGYEVLFELGDGTERLSATGFAVFDAPSAGEYCARATIVGTDVSEEYCYDVDRGGFSVSWIIYASAACIFLLGTVLALKRERDNGRRNNRRGGNPRYAPRRRRCGPFPHAFHTR